MTDCSEGFADSAAVRKPGADRTQTLAVVTAATMLVLIIFTVPLTTLEPTALALAAGAGAQAWILSAMPLGAAIGLLAGGALGDNHGRRRVFLGGLLVMTLGSALGALSPHAAVLIVARVVQGLGGAAVLACGLGLIGIAYPEPRARTRATGIWAAGLGAGVATGPIIAVLLTMAGGWTGAYWGSAALAACLLAIGRGALPAAAARPEKSVDWAGTILLMAGLGLALTSLTEARLGLVRPGVIVPAIGGIALLIAFVLVERRHANPVLDLSLFRSADFVGATVAAFASGAGILALMSLVPFVLTHAMGTSALSAAFALTAWSATSVVTALGARWLPEAWSRSILAASLGAATVAQLALLGARPDGGIASFLPGLFLAGAANGVLNASLGRQAVATVPPEHAAMGSGANNTARYLGSAIGITVGAVLMAHGADIGGLEGLLAGWDEAVLITAGFSIAGAIIVACVRD